MRIRTYELDPVVAFMALAVTALGLVLGVGLWAVAAGLLIFTAAAGSRSGAKWATRRFALPPDGSLERVLVMRSRESADTMRRLVRSVPDGPVTTRCLEMERQARAALPTIRALALQTFRVHGLADGIPVERLDEERAHTLSLLAGNPEERLRMELESSLRSTESPTWDWAPAAHANGRALCSNPRPDDVNGRRRCRARGAASDQCFRSDRPSTARAREPIARNRRPTRGS
jgi:hypothetical protein